MNGSVVRRSPLALVPLGLSLGGFFAISFWVASCALIVPDGAMHRPWLQFFPASSG